MRVLQQIYDYEKVYFSKERWVKVRIVVEKFRNPRPIMGYMASEDGMDDKDGTKPIL